MSRAPLARQRPKTSPPARARPGDRPQVPTSRHHVPKPSLGAPARVRVSARTARAPPPPPTEPLPPCCRQGPGSTARAPDVPPRLGSPVGTNRRSPSCLGPRFHEGKMASPGAPAGQSRFGAYPALGDVGGPSLYLWTWGGKRSRGRGTDALLFGSNVGPAAGTWPLGHGGTDGLHTPPSWKAPGRKGGAGGPGAARLKPRTGGRGARGGPGPGHGRRAPPRWFRW